MVSGVGLGAFPFIPLCKARLLWVVCCNLKNPHHGCLCSQPTERPFKPCLAHPKHTNQSQWSTEMVKEANRAGGEGREMVGTSTESLASIIALCEGEGMPSHNSTLLPADDYYRGGCGYQTESPYVKGVRDFLPWHSHFHGFLQTSNAEKVGVGEGEGHGVGMRVGVRRQEGGRRPPPPPPLFLVSPWRLVVRVGEGWKHHGVIERQRPRDITVDNET
ncbi:hypothetical protein BHE74_00005416 [Ensete ventricosum]|uniref:Uncharacterized protein n=1 Tax=Ensete ventricosum TaxID=4639 RepID=A0A444CDE9_ENSVE|nr:hypothetical protein GW17_00054449 [Ensete ventricosum]RWW85870.1 hypothetical protein BHE74_00005416 [Ensete ventricosum]RZR74347.1 hypothetical protein BHM03_00035750 [Ensete ventricosum]